MTESSPHTDGAFVGDRGGLSRWWSTPIFMHRWPDHAETNRGLEALVLEKMATSPSQTRSNIGGWHSDDDLNGWPGPAAAQLRAWIVAAMGEVCRVAAPGQAAPRRVRLSGWANVNRAGDSNAAHEHGNHSWSGVYYVKTGGGRSPAETGYLELRDPRSGAGRFNIGLASLGGSSLVSPEPGLMVMFPSWLLHAVRPHAGPGVRISIAFNIGELP